MNAVYYAPVRGPMCQFWIVETARAKYLVTWGEKFDPFWGYARVLKELPR